MTARPDPLGVAAAVLAVGLGLVQWWVFEQEAVGRGRAAVLLSWQAAVVVLCAGGALAGSRRLRVGLYSLGALAALLYGMLSWAVGGAVDVAVAALLVWGAVRPVGTRPR